MGGSRLARNRSGFSTNPRSHSSFSAASFFTADAGANVAHDLELAEIVLAELLHSLRALLHVVRTQRAARGETDTGQALRHQCRTRRGPRAAGGDSDNAEAPEPQSVRQLGDVGDPPTERESDHDVRSANPGSIDSDQPNAASPGGVLLRVRRPDTRAGRAVHEDDRRAVKVTPLPVPEGPAIPKPQHTGSNEAVQLALFGRVAHRLELEPVGIQPVGREAVLAVLGELLRVRRG